MRDARAIIYGEIKAGWTYRAGIFLAAFYGPIYITIFYFLWRAVFSHTPGGTVNGMDFTSTVTYLTIARLIYGLFHSYIAWEMFWTVRSGNLILLMCRPMGFMYYYVARWLGGQILTLTIITIPNIIFVYFFIPVDIHFTTMSLLFIPSLILGLIIGFALDYIGGTIAFYTESIYGVLVAMGVLMEFFSGQLIPVAFFPGVLKNVAMLLPFQASINTPVLILMNPGMGLKESLPMILVQLFWAAALILFAMFFFSRASRKVTVNGG